MKRGRYLWVIVLLSLMVLAIHLEPAGAETTNCTAITSLPYTISTQGIYCLKGNLATSMTSGNAITINTNNVVIDLNGYKIGGLAAGPSTIAVGIGAHQRQNITIRNGTVRGFSMGIQLYDDSPYTTSQGHIIEDIRADMNTSVGIAVLGRGNIIRNNQVVATGGGSVGNDAYGISVIGPGNRVINNDVYETKEQGVNGVAFGIYAYSASGLVVENNRVGNAAMGSGASHGIAMFSSGNAMVKDNTITTMDTAILYSGTGTGSNGLYMNNLASGCTNFVVNGTPAGSTNYSN